MSKDVKFIVSIIRDDYRETKDVPKYEILGYREVSDNEVKEIGGGYSDPIYGKCIGTKKKEIIHPGNTFVYEQIPLRLADMSFSVVSTSYRQTCSYEEGKMNICEKVANMGEFCPTEKLMEVVYEANQHYQYRPYHISYGYHYTNESGEKISQEFETQEERDQSALEEVGYDFNQLDWSDKIGPSTKQDIPKQALK